jgi:hypothetical protein
VHSVALTVPVGASKVTSGFNRLLWCTEAALAHHQAAACTTDHLYMKYCHARDMIIQPSNMILATAVKDKSLCGLG